MCIHQGYRQYVCTSLFIVWIYHICIHQDTQTVCLHIFVYCLDIPHVHSSMIQTVCLHISVYCLDISHLHSSRHTDSMSAHLCLLSRYITCAFIKTHKQYVCTSLFIVWIYHICIHQDTQTVCLHIFVYCLDISHVHSSRHTDSMSAHLCLLSRYITCAFIKTHRQYVCTFLFIVWIYSQQKLLSDCMDINTDQTSQGTIVIRLIYVYINTMWV